MARLRLIAATTISLGGAELPGHPHLPARLNGPYTFPEKRQPLDMLVNRFEIQVKRT